MKIAFLGDVVIDRGVKVDKDVHQFLKKAKYIVANLEGIILKSKSSAPPFKTYGSLIYNDYDSIMNLIEETGITHVNLYNNHMIDYGESQFENTLKVLTDAGIQIIRQENDLKISHESSIRLNNSGLAETFGIYNLSKIFGQNINDMLLEKEPVKKWAGTIIHSHFGIEQVAGLSEYEYRWFLHMVQFNPRIIIRHHSHCIQSPFKLNDVPCFPSIGDFAFNFNKKKASKGLAVLFDATDSNIDFLTIECIDYNLKIASEQMAFQYKPALRLSQNELKELRIRYLNEYREDGLNSLKKALKYFIRREKAEHVLSMSTKHFIQPFVLEEIL